MSAPYKSVFVQDDNKDAFDYSLDMVLNYFNMNFSEFVRAAVLNGQMLSKDNLSQFMSREARKSGNYRYLVLAVEVEK